MFADVARGVHAYAHDFVDGHCAVIVGTRGAVAVDAGIAARDGRALTDFMRDRGHGRGKLVLTHTHPDHVLGSASFRDREVIAHRKAEYLMRTRHRQAFERLTERSFDEIAAEIAWPTETFDDVLTIDLGDIEIELLPTPGHTPDSICVRVPSERVLIAGDTVVESIVPAFFDGNSVVLERSLEAISHLEIDVLVPGHGQVLTGADAIRGHIGWQIDYLRDVRMFVADRLDLPDEEVTAIDSYADLVGDRFPRDVNRMGFRHQRTIESMLAELRRSST